MALTAFMKPSSIMLIMPPLTAAVRISSALAEAPMSLAMSVVTSRTS
jgi:hypothetical protein